ncbi:hypothetical protein POSPLADRAFT_1148763 [Postia placenta MAD-698-R-SB12]|uniref:sn-1-specific diacylglycerol lipase n=1 Tax=Postia placenta MAD-698-R-SB12 TaxID=670580 RepID=A0A1X6MWK6_9APHY|nr:hypothetical protein POSPLADRAFT_1148763 [Postia placenta MAD-698-R-SB12]OSX60616.1 hypothetical protein POSPLADRAFT_1148763 [Postia placenta MAD-698-R-SB12]
MSSKWDKYSRIGLNVASTATSVGFSAAKAGTKLGFSITREIASTAAGVTGSALDQAFFGGSVGAGPILGGAVSTAISTIESLALAPILIGESLTSTSFVAAQSSLSALSTIFPGSDEASFSLASFVGLVRREWTEPVDSDGLPEEKYSLAKIMKALVGWATLQGVTSDWQERQWFAVMKEIEVNDEASDAISPAPRQRVHSDVHITNDTIYPGRGGQIVTADIGEATEASSPTPPPGSSRDTHSLLSDYQLKHTLRRLSKLVLAGYGGPSLLFFGVTPWQTSKPSSVPFSSEKEKSKEEAKLTDAVGVSEAESSDNNIGATGAAAEPGKPSYSWWNVLMGRHDHDIFLQHATSSTVGQSEAQPRPPTAFVGTENLMPRFWVLTDHARREVVLVIRGTMSLNEIAVDLTCDTAPFELYTPKASRAPKRPRAMSSVPVPSVEPAIGPESDDESHTTHLVHGGMLKMARAMGAPGKPVHVAVRDALRRNRGYSLVLCGHSLGAGVAALLALMWANPRTRLTHQYSRLPQRRSVSAYCFAPPCMASTQLARLAGESGLVTSFVYGHDVVSRLSLGSVRDLTRCAAWLCQAEVAHGEGYSAVTKRALRWKAGFRDEGDEEWFLSMRKTLEANMHMTQLFPPGRVLWALRDGDLQSANRLREADGRPRQSGRGEEKVRLFEVHDVERAFGQVVFARDMLSSHMPHQYDRVLHELL